jgi:hypothetical protein
VFVLAVVVVLEVLDYKHHQDQLKAVVLDRHHPLLVLA